jgi:hypothetical protein
MSFDNYALNAGDFCVIQESLNKRSRSSSNRFPWALLAQAELQSIFACRELSESRLSNHFTPRVLRLEYRTLVTPGKCMGLNSEIISESFDGDFIPVFYRHYLSKTKYFINSVYRHLRTPKEHEINTKPFSACLEINSKNNGLARLVNIKLNLINAHRLHWIAQLFRSRPREFFSYRLTSQRALMI